MRLQSALRSHLITAAGFLLTAAFFAACLNAQAPGYWQTSGNQIVDSNNAPVRIAGVNWYGFENQHQVVQGLWIKDYHAIMNAIKSNGYNTIRLPFSNQMVESPIIPDNIQFNVSGHAINTDLQGLNSLQIMDKVVEYAGQIGLHIILDNHRSSAGDGGTESRLWYTYSYPESVWIQDWQTLATRYLNNPTVIGVDLRNEPHGAQIQEGGSCWSGDVDCTPDRNWHLAAQRGGNAVLSINPHLLVFVEGTDCYNNDCNWWGGNLEGVQNYRVQLNLQNQLVYSAHEYGPSLYQQPWFNGSTSYSSLSTRFTKFWGYVSQGWIAPVWVGEFGTPNNNSDVQDNAAGSEGQWFQSMITYLQNNPAMNWTYWAINGEDVDGLLNVNYDSTPANPLKQQVLASIQSPIAKTPLRFVPVTPCRITDTRTDDGPFGGPILSGGASRNFVIPNSACGIPANAQAYSLNVTVVPSNKLGFLTVWPAGQSRPGVSTLNSLDGRTKANAAIIPAGDQGGISVFATDDTHFVLDINGYFVRAADNPAQAFYPVVLPCRVADTRTAAGLLGAPYLSGGQSRDFPVLLSACNLPANAQAYSLNFTAIPHGPLGYLTTWPAGQMQPVVSTLNATTGAVTANAAIVPAGRNGDISVFARNDTDLVIDVNGYFAAPGTGGLSLYNVQPCRTRDTRDDQNSIGISGTLGVRVTGSVCDVGNDAQAYVMNATVVPQAVQGNSASLAYLTLYPEGQTRPGVSTLNATDGQITSNMAILPAGNLGFIDAYATNWTHLILDVSSYFAP